MSINWNNSFENHERDDILESFLRENFQEHEINTDQTEKLCGKALLVACEKGAEEVARILISKNVELNVTNATGYTPLLLACERGQLELARLIINSKAANLTAKTFNNYDALMLACEYGHEKIANLLLESGASVNNFTSTSNMDLLTELDSPLSLACKNGHKNLVKLLLYFKADLQRNIFSLSCLNGYRDIVELLIKHDPSILVKSRPNYLITEACRLGHIEIIKFLIEKGVNVNYDYPSGGSPLFIACRKGNKKLVEFLISEGADLTTTDLYARNLLNLTKNDFNEIFVLVRNRLIRQVYEILRSFEEAYGKQDSKRAKRRNFVYSIFKKPHLDAVKAIDPNDKSTDYDELRREGVLSYFLSVEFKQKLQIGLIADLNEQKSLLALEKNRILRLAPELKFNPNEKSVNNYRSMTRFLELWDIILNNKLLTEINKETNKKERLEKCKYFLVNINNFHKIINDQLSQINELYSIFTNDKMIEFLMLKESASNFAQREIQTFHLIRNLSSKSSILVASENGNVSLVNYLLKYYANELENTDSEGETALFKACLRGHFNIAKLLIEKGANVNVINKYRENILFFCSPKEVSFLDFLIQKGIEINQQNIYGQSALIVECRNGRVDAVKYLVERGADVNLKDNYGQSAISIALTNNYMSIVDYLIEKGADLHTQDKIGQNLVSIAFYKNHVDLALDLINKGIDLINENSLGGNLLMQACLKNDLKMVELLINRGIDVQKVNHRGENALFFSVLYKQESEEDFEHFTKIVESLLSKGVDVNCQNNYGETCVFVACKYNNVQAVRYLVLEKKAQLFIRNQDGMSALLWLLRDDGKMETKQFLITVIIESFFNQFQTLSVNRLREQVIESIDQEEDTFVIKVDHLKAFEWIRENQLSNIKNIFEYFQSFDFKEKLIEDVINILKDQIEYLNIVKLKLIELCPFITDEEISHNILLEPDNQLTFSNLKQLMQNNNLIEFIHQTQTHSEQPKKCQIIFKNIIELIEKIDGKLKLADYLYSLL
jgi:ankyrin repeat protein